MHDLWPPMDDYTLGTRIQTSSRFAGHPVIVLTSPPTPLEIYSLQNLRHKSNAIGYNEINAGFDLKLLCSISPGILMTLKREQ